MTINEKINNRSWNARIEKVKGYKGMGFSCGVYGTTLKEVVSNGGTNLKAANRTDKVHGLKDKFQNTPCHNRWYQK